MICNCCNKEVELKNFFGKDRCYQCLYKYKLQIINLAGSMSKSNNYCKICKKKLSIRKRSYCSKECSDKRAENHWSRKIDTKIIDPLTTPWGKKVLKR